MLLLAQMSSRGNLLNPITPTKWSPKAENIQVCLVSLEMVHDRRNEELRLKLARR